MKIGIYNRYWGTMGGGEKHVGTIAEILSRDHDVELIRVTPLDVDEFCSRMNLDLSRVSWVDWPGDSCAQLAPRSEGYDLFINSTYMSPMMSQARRSAYLVFFPHDLGETMLPARAIEHFARRLRAAGHPWVADRLSSAAAVFHNWIGPAARRFLESYQILMANSAFTGQWVARRWRRQAVVLPPPIEIERFRANASAKKERLILSVGRFFAGGHNKKHLQMQEVFRRMCDSGAIPDGWEYHLAGSVHSESAEHVDYFAKVNELAKGYPVKVLSNLGSAQLQSEYARASVFWHGAGWGEDESRHPEKMEHFGMTTCEAMASGCVPIVMASGGQREIVEDGCNGFHFRNAEELEARTRQVIGMFGSDGFRRLSQRAAHSVEKYSKAAFEVRLRKILDC